VAIDRQRDCVATCRRRPTVPVTAMFAPASAALIKSSAVTLEVSVIVAAGDVTSTAYLRYLYSASVASRVPSRDTEAWIV